MCIRPTYEHLLMIKVNHIVRGACQCIPFCSRSTCSMAVAGAACSIGACRYKQVTKLPMAGHRCCRWMHTDGHMAEILSSGHGAFVMCTCQFMPVGGCSVSTYHCLLDEGGPLCMCASATTDADPGQHRARDKPSSTESDKTSLSLTMGSALTCGDTR